ncbi:MAG TPA: peptidase [Kiloniellales bacterium]
MTYCLGIKIDHGLVCLSDGRITSGRQVTSAHKASLHGPAGAEFCIMTSGLRSLRDKTVAYLDRALGKGKSRAMATMLDAVDAYGKCLRQVAREDAAAIKASDLTFDLHAIIAGQLPEDAEPTMFLVYPEGNWIEVEQRTPYLSIGATAYGKPILDRALSHETGLKTALKLAYLSFDSSRTSSADVGFPIDLTILLRGERRWRTVHYEYDDLLEQRVWWNEHITRLARDMPDGPWVEALLGDQGAGRLTLVADD